MYREPFPGRSSIHALPVELLSYIFVLGTHFLDASEDDSELQEVPPFNTESVKAPLVFSSVCRHWRLVAFNTPALWTSICITVGSLEASANKSSCRDVIYQEPRLKTSRIESYLSLSRKCPLDILLDVRDINWDFCEPEISFIDHSEYTVPFSPSNMKAVMSLLLPHLSRWRSIDILTDTWAPMHTALTMLNVPLTKHGAPLLESLTLMRCNDYISHSPQFQPQRMKHPFFLKPDGSLPHTSAPLLPRLRKTVLRGVHVDWSSLPCLLPADSPALHTLELSSHSLDVRPTISEFRDILASCSSLQTLVVNGSGLFIDEDIGLSLKLGARASRLDKRLSPISLPHLKELTVGYRTALDGCYVLSMLEAPNIRVLTLEDATNPSDVDEVDAAVLLRYVATRDVTAFSPEYEEYGYYDPTNPTFRTYEDDEDESDVQSTRSVIPPTPSLSLGSSHSHLRSDTGRSLTLSPFPLLEKVILKGIKACTKDFQTFFLSLPHLKSLDIRGMPQPMLAVIALPSTFNVNLPNISTSPSPSPQSPDSQWDCKWAALCSAPCPQLQRLCIRGGRLRMEDLEYIVKDLVNNRSMGRAYGLQQLDVYLDSNSRDYLSIARKGLFETCSSTSAHSSCGIVPSNPEADSGLPTPPGSGAMIVRVYKASESDSEDGDGSIGSDADSTVDHELEDAFRYGGAFNDPIFDAQYSYPYSYSSAAFSH